MYSRVRWSTRTNRDLDFRIAEDQVGGSFLRNWYRAAAAALALGAATSASASEKIQYTYDALGRVVQVSRSGPISQGASANYQYDPADNRASVAVTTSWTSPVWRAGDYNGDRRSDILWRNDIGTLTDWLGAANGGWTDNAANAASSVDLQWTVIAIGDFNGDGRSDILWQRNTGQLAAWLGTTSGSFTGNTGVSFNTIGSDWHVAGVGDFNGDGYDDILFRCNDGRITDWLGSATGALVINSANALTSVTTDWHVSAVGDFNGDGRADILWRNNDGRMFDWLGLTNGGFNGNAANSLNSVSTDWHIVGAGDFNGDGRDDILWRDDDGRLADWLGTSTGGFTGNGANSATTVATNWRVAGIGDFNGDGRDDILWQSTTGAITNWLGTTAGGFVDNASVAYTTVDTQWKIEPSNIGGLK